MWCGFVELIVVTLVVKGVVAVVNVLFVVGVLEKEVEGLVRIR